MKRILIYFFALFASIIVISSCTEKKPDTADIIVLYTTDTHGACLQYDFKKDKPAETSLANVCSYVKQERETNTDKIILLDNGDFLQGQPSIYYYNFVDTISNHISAQVFNYLGYDAIGVGNHDIEPGESVYGGRLQKMLDMPWICANAIDTRTGNPLFQPYAVIKRQGIKVVVLGMITPNIHAWLPKTLWPNLEFEDMVECAKKWVPEIQKKEKPDILIGLFHSGGDYTYGGQNEDTPFNENGGIPAAMKVPGFDLVLLGHDHYSRDMDIINVAGDSVKIMDAATQARFVGRADIHLKLTEDGTYKKSITKKMIDTKQYAPDPEFCSNFEPVINTVNEYVDAKIGTMTEDLDGIDGLYGPCKFMDLIHNAQLWATNADVSMATVLSPYDKIPAGEITMRHLFTIYKYENQLFTLSMSGADVKKYLEFGFSNQFATMKNAKDPLINRTEDGKPAVPSFNYTSAAGIKYEVDITKPAGTRVNIISMSDGSVFDMNKEYKVAINSYQASGGGNFIPVGLGWSQETLEAHTIDTTPIDVRRYVASYIKEQGTITPKLRGDWRIIPTDLWEAGKANEIANADRSHR